MNVHIVEKALRHIATGAAMAAVVAAWSADRCDAATLTAGPTTSAVDHRTAAIEISLGSAESEHVASLQCDVFYPDDTMSLAEVTEGPASLTAEKLANYYVLEDGWARIVVTGFNRDEIPDGVVARLVFDWPPGASSGEYLIQLDRTIVSDTNGVQVAADSVDGILTIETDGTSDRPVDANQDGNIDALDVQTVINSVLGCDVAGNPDIDGNGVVNAIDVQLVINSVLGL